MIVLPEKTFSRILEDTQAYRWIAALHHSLLLGAYSNFVEEFEGIDDLKELLGIPLELKIHTILFLRH
jgi:hypothetical protein